MTANAQAVIEVYQGAVVVRSGGKVVGRFDRDVTGTATVNLGDHPDAETPDTEGWTAFTPAALYRDGREIDPPPGVGVWKNNLYTVHVHRLSGGGAYLSIRSNDRHWRHDWRHLFRIKNDLLGDDVEAVELYPARDRLVDDANQFHLWALPAGQRFPFGFGGPDDPTLTDPADPTGPAGTKQHSGYRQRPFAPADAAPARTPARGGV